MRNVIKALLVVSIVQLGVLSASYISKGVNYNKAWEYKVVSDFKENTYPTSHPNNFYSNDGLLTALGNEGWELVDTYTILETVHPNFGNSSYVTGLQPNVRTKELVFIYKRRKS